MALTYNIQFNADTRSLHSQVAVIQKDLAKAFDLHLSGEIGKELNGAVRSAQVLESALRKATTINGTSFNTLNAELKKAGTSAGEIVSNLSGAQMRDAASQFINTFTFADRSAIVLSGRIKEIGRVLTQSFKFSIAQDFLRFMDSALDSGIRWSKEMNQALTNISIVTEATGENLDNIFNKVLEGAQKLNVAAKEYAEAALIFYQQGLGDDEVARRSEITVKAAKAAGQSTQEMSQQLTAVWNTYKMQGDRLEDAASIGARLGADTAVDFKYIAEAMQSSAAAASQLGVSYESLAAIIATVGETSLQSASVVGNAYKTIFSRFANLKTTGEDQGVTLGRITEQFAEMGINVLDSAGELKELDTVIMEIGKTWDNYSVKQQQAIAQIAGGTRQFGQFLSLMNNFDKYEANLASAMTEEGGETLEKQYDIYQQSIEAGMARAKEAWAVGFAGIFEQDSIKSFYTFVENAGNAFGDIVKTVGGLPGILAVVATLMQKQILSSAVGMATSIKETAKNLTLQQRIDNSLLNIQKQRQIVGAAFDRTNSVSLMNELMLTDQKLAASEKINQTVAQLQNLRANGNIQQQQEAAMQLQILETAQQKYFAALDEQRVAEQNLQVVNNTLTAEQRLTEEGQKQILNAQRELDLANARVVDTESGFNGAAEGAGEAANSAVVGTQKLSQSLMSLAMGGMMAGMAISQLSSLVSGDLEPSFGTITGIIMSTTMALMSIIPAITSLIPTLYGMTGAFAVATVGMTAAEKAAYLAGLSFKTMLIGLLPYIAIFVAAIAGIVAVVALVVAAYKNWAANTPEGKLKAAKEEANNLAEAAEETKQKVDELRQAFDKYDSAVEALESCRRGTDEWRAALEEVNNQVLDILTNFPELAKMDDFFSGRDENGMLQLNKEIMDSALQAAKDQENAAKYASMLANTRVTKAENDILKKGTNIEGYNLSHYDNASTAYSNEKSAVSSSNYESIDALGNAAKKAAEAFEKGTETDLREAIKKNIQEIGTYSEKSAEELDKLTDSQMEGATEYLNSLNELAAAQNAYAIQLQNTLDSIANQELEGKYGDAETKAAAVAYGNEVENATKTLFDEIKGWGQVGKNKGNAEVDDIWSRYLAASGKELELDSNSIRGSGNDRTFAYTDPEDAGKTIEVKAKEVASTIAAYEALGQLEISAQEASNKLNLLDKSVKEGKNTSADAEAARKMIAQQDFDSFTRGEYEDLKTSVGEDSTAYLTELAENMGITLDELAEMAGFKGEDAALQFVAKFDENLKIDWDSVGDFDGNELISFDNISFDAAKAIQDTFDIAKLGAMGEEGGKAYIDGLNNILSKVNPEQQSEALEALTKVDWSQWNAGSSAVQVMEDLGIQVDTTSQEWITFTNAMKEATNASPVAMLEETIANLNKLASIVGEVKIGDIFSDEDYQTIVANNAELKKYFLTMADGSHQVVGGIEAINDLDIADKTAMLKELAGGYEQIVEAMKTGNSLSGYNLSEVFAIDESEIQNFADAVNILEGIGDVGALQNFVNDETNPIVVMRKQAEELANNSAAIDMLKAIGYDKDELTAMLNDYTAQGTGEIQRMLNAFSAAVNAGNTGAYENSVIEEMVASTAKSIDELENQFHNGAISAETFWKALDNTAMKEAEGLGLDGQEVLDYAKHLQEVADESDLVSDELTNNKKAALETATAVMRLNRGVDALAEGFKDWNDVLKKSDKSSEEYFEAMQGIKEAMADVLNISSESLTNDFITDNLDDIKQAATGSAEAIDRLQMAAAKSIVLNFTATLDDTDVANQITSKFDELQSYIANNPLEIGATVTPETHGEFLKLAQDFANMALAAGMSAESVADSLGSMGFDSEIKTTYEKTKVKVPTYTTMEEYVPGGTMTAYDPSGEPYQIPLSGKRSYTIPGEPIEVEGYVPVSTVEVKSMTKTSGGKMNNYSSVNAGGPPAGGGGKKGGGGGKAKQAKAEKPVKADKTHQRYDNINASIKVLTKSIDKLNEAEDNAFGLARVALIQKKNKKLQELGSLYTLLAKEAKAYMVEDRKALEAQMKEKGFNQEIKYDEYGFISNPEEIQRGWDNALKIAEDAMNAYIAKYNKMSGDQQEKAKDEFEAEKEKFEAKKEEVAELQEAYDKYGESVDKAQEAIQLGVDNIRTWMTNKITEVEYKVELRMSINDRDIRLIQQTLDQLGSRQYEALMSGWNEQTDQIVANSKELIAGAERYNEIMNNIKDPNMQNWFINGDGGKFKGFGQDAWDEYQKFGKVPADLMDAMLANVDQMIDLKDSFYEMNDKMWSVLHEALESYLSDFDNYLQRFDDHESILKSWNNIWKSTGQQYKDTALSVDLLNRSIDNQQSKVLGLQQKYGLMTDSLKLAEEQYKLALDSQGADSKHTQESYEKWQQLLADTHSMEAEIASNIETMMSMIAEAAAESAAVIRKEFNEGFNGLFSDMNSAMDMYNQKKDIDNFYLHEDDLNFELDKMLRETAKDMENVTDPKILENYSKWMDKINGLKEDGTKMTQESLDILKAEFELDKMKAEFEEQQKAKNTMRLSRDTSGNWSYVYSNDAGEDTADKEAEIEEKINNIAKMHREAADAAAEMWLQLNKDLEEYTANIDWLRYENDMKYKEEVDQRLSWYNQQLNQNAGEVILHNEAIDRSFKDTTLGVITDMDSMEQANNDYKQNHEEMKEALKENHDEYQDKVKETLENVGYDEKELAGIIRDVSEDIMNENEQVGQSMEELRSRANENLNEIMSKVSEWSERWKNGIRSIIAEINALIAATQALARAQAGSADTDFDPYEDYTNSLQQGEAEGKDEAWMKKKETELYYKLKASFAEDLAAYNGDKDLMLKVQKEWNNSRYHEGMTLEEFLANKNYDTGGLVMGPQIAGLAVDGKKELVLNNTDTENFLQAISIMREGIASYLNNIGVRQAGTIAGTQSQDAPSQTSETPVIIQADFPNVTAREEIEAAFANLVNQAAQYKIKPRN